MRKIVPFVLLILLLWQSNPAFCEHKFQPSVIREKNGLNWNAIMSDQETGQLSLIGQISPNTSDLLRDSAEPNLLAKDLMVDSMGGDADASFAISKMMKKRNLNIIVDGRCLSACAQILFVSAKKKTVLKDSIIGVHEPFIYYQEAGQRKAVAYQDAEIVVTAAKDTQALDGIKKMKENFQDLYKEAGISENMYAPYSHYLSNRKKIFGADFLNFNVFSPSCPAIRMWALNKRQLIEFGVKDIGDFWYPNTPQEQEQIVAKYKLPKGSIFFGEAASLENLCKESSSNALHRKFYDVLAIARRF